MQTSTSRYYCAAEGCFSDTKKLGTYGYMSQIDFFPFPTEKKDPKSRRIWLNLLRRQDYNPPRHHRVCSLHFVDGKPTNAHPYPTLFDYNNFKEPKQSRSTQSISKRSRIVPGSENKEEQLGSPECVESGYSIGFQDQYQNVLHIETQTGEYLPPIAYEEVITSVDGESSQDHCVQGPHLSDHDYQTPCCVDGAPGGITETSTQTELSMEDMTRLMELKEKFSTPNVLMKDIFIDKVTGSDECVMHYTGIPSKATLNGLFGILEKASSKLKYWSGQETANNLGNSDKKKSGPARKLSKYEEFIMTLVRLRLAIFTFFLADIFGVSNTRVSQIFTTWVNFMYNVFTPLLIWPSSQIVKKFSPRSFKLSFPNVVCIIDCTEFFIHKPRSPTAQSKTYSSYKHHNTYKSLIGITPSGAIIFVSNLWGGNTSDRYITKASSFLQYVKPGDEIMADRGFLIRDLLLKKRAKLIIPPFTKHCSWGKGKRLLQHDIVRTRCIARMRIHVERAIERIKNFHILGNTMPLTLKPLANQILKVCAFLCNLQKPLVKK